MARTNPQMKVLRVALAVFLLTLVTFAQRPLDSAKVDQIISADMAAKLTPATINAGFRGCRAFEGAWRHAAMGVADAAELDSVSF